ncbi:hypothetical protein [Nitrosomonas marina]|nr:hypothetical protein [Nitrosomonas marina]
MINLNRMRRVEEETLHGMAMLIDSISAHAAEKTIYNVDLAVIFH